jgi:importin subunit beta-1
MSELATVLQNAQSVDPIVRNQAEQHLNGALDAQYGPFILALCAEFATEGNAPQIRQLAGLYLKNVIHADDASILEQKMAKWKQCETGTKEQIKAGFVQALTSQDVTVRHTCAQIIAAYGAADLSNWPTLIPTLLQYVLNPETPVGTVMCSLESLGFLCDAIDPDQMAPEITNQILSAIVDGLKVSRPNDVRLAAIVALNNSLDYTSANFENENERDAIMQTICEATQCTDVRVREKAFECIAKVADLYYEKLGRYVNALFDLTTGAIRNDDQTVGLQAIEFWSTICDCEMAIQDAIDEGMNEPYFRYAEQAVAQLIPILLETLTKQAEDSDLDDSWNISMAGATCLDSMAKTVRDMIVDHVLPFVTSNIQNTQWRMKEAAIMAFGCVLDGPSEEKMLPIVAQAVPVLLTCMKDAKASVRDTTAWTMGKICELHKNAISSEMLPTLVDALSTALDDQNTKVAAQACFAVHNLADACADENEAQSNILSHFLAPMLQKLFIVANRPDWNEENLRVSAYEAANMLIANSAMDMVPIVVQVLQEVMTRLEATYQPSTNTEEKTNLQSMLCSMVGVCMQKLGTEHVTSNADRAMQLMLEVFSAKGAVAHEDAFMAIGIIADKIGTAFMRYMSYLQPSLINGLKNVEEYQVCTVAVGLVGDLCRALGAQIMTYCDDIMRCLIELLQSTVLNKSVKPHVISCFADVAMAIEGNFDRYTAVILGMLQQAGEISVTTQDEDLIEYINTLHVAVIESYSGIIQGLKSANKQDIVLPAVESIFNLLRRTSERESKDENVLKGAVGLLGDLAQTYGKRIHMELRQPYVNVFLQEGVNDEDIKDTALWAQSVCIHVCLHITITITINNSNISIVIFCAI